MEHLTKLLAKVAPSRRDIIQAIADEIAVGRGIGSDAHDKAAFRWQEKCLQAAIYIISGGKAVAA